MRPQPGPQTLALALRAIEILFFGGARGGGKSLYLLIDWLVDVPTYGKDWQGILFRASHKELEQIQKEMLKYFPLTGAKYQPKESVWIWPNGASLKLRHLRNVHDCLNYQGHEYTWMGFDELPNMRTLEAFFKLIGCLRSSANVPTKRIRATGNPGGPSHSAVKSYFIDPSPRGYQPIFDPKSETTRVFIPSRVEDNPALLFNDPGYVKRLEMVGSPALVRSWLKGDWDAVQGAYYPELGDEHIIQPFTIPRHWQRIRAFDFGSADPACCLWAAVSDGSLEGIPRDALVFYREWYVAKFSETKWEGLRLDPPRLAQGILARQSDDERIELSVADRAFFKSETGPSLAEHFWRTNRLKFSRADDSRIAGWNQIRSRLVGVNGVPYIYFFKTMEHTIRCLMALQHCEKDAEDVASGLEDHAPDCVRYICMARPRVIDLEQKHEDIKGTYQEIDPEFRRYA